MLVLIQKAKSSGIFFYFNLNKSKMKLRKQKRLERRMNSWNLLKAAPNGNPNDKEGVNAKRTYCRKPGSNNK